LFFCGIVTELEKDDKHIYIPTPKNNGQRKTDKLVPKQGTSNGSIQALNINSSENGA
jgi:hypothetical protein